MESKSRTRIEGEKVGAARKWRSAICAGLLMTAISAPASAAFVDAVPGQVEYGQNVLLVQFPGSPNYIAQTAAYGAIGCGITNPNLDTVKIWANLAQAALLSGKTLRVYFTTCNGYNYIGGLVLFR